MDAEFLRYVANIIDALGAVKLPDKGDAHCGCIPIFYYGDQVGELRDEHGEGYDFYPGDT